MAGAGRGVPLLSGRPRPHAVETIAWHSSMSMMAESFRATSASLLLPQYGGARVRVILISSVSPGEGKTTVASNMAIALAGVGGKVLLVDGDRRRARLHKVFGCANERGLSELLMANGETHPLNDGFVVQTMAPNLYLLPSGKASLSTSDIFYSQRMAELIGQLRRDFDTVLIDTPPLLHLPDARILGRLTDGVILVVRAAQARRESVAAVERRLSHDGIPVLGTILNDWDSRRGGYDYYSENKRIYSYFAR